MVRDTFRLITSLSSRERYFFFGALTVFVFTLGLNLLNNFYNNTILEPASGGEYTEGIVGQPIAINPILAGTNEADQVLMRTMFSDLISLAESYATSSDGKIWSVKLRGDLEWSDGEPINSDDVVWTVQAMQNPAASSPQLSAWQGVTIERISEREIRFTLKAAYGFFLDNLKSLYIAPSHVFEAIPVANLHLSNYNLEPVSSGPYKFAGYEKEKNGFISSYHLEANPKYPGKPALIENLNFVFFLNYNDAFLSFNNKTIDGLGGYDPIDDQSLRINHQTRELELPRYYAVFFNPTVQSALNDTKVREALNLAIDKQRLIETALNGKGSVAYGPISSFIEGFSSSTYAHERFSTEEAITLLEKNKWKKDSEGIMTRTVGKTTQRLTIELLTPDLPFLITTANQIAADWAKIGAQVSVTALSLDELRETHIKPRNYQALLFGNVLKGNADVYSFWHSSQRFSPGLNLAVYRSVTVDNLLDSIRKSFDINKRASDLAKVQQIIHDERPAIFLYTPHYLYAAPKDLGGFDETFLHSPSDRFINVGQWFLETNRVFK